MTSGLAVLRGIRDANFHRPGIRCLRLYRLTQDFFTSLTTEVTALRRTESPSRAGEPGHITSWTRPSGQVLQFSLWNASGRYDDFTTDHDLSCFGKRFRDGAKYPRVAELLDALPHLVNCRVNVLGSGARLSAHEEHVLFRDAAGAVGVRARFHLPLATNPGAELSLDGAVHHLAAGFIYFVNHGCVHSASNDGSGERIHLVWDMLMTPEGCAAMFDGDLAALLPVQVVTHADRDPTPRRQEVMGPFARLPDPVSPAEADSVTFCLPQ